MLSLQSTNTTYYQNQHQINTNTISLLRDLVIKQSAEIRKMKQNNNHKIDNTSPFL